jgi:ankyrin repeat protein
VRPYLALRDDAPTVAVALLASPALKVDAANAKGETALMMAALRGRLDWTHKLVERGAKVQREGRSPVHYAATGPNTRDWSVVRTSTRWRRTAVLLWLAARHDPEDSVKLPLQRGAN